MALPSQHSRTSASGRTYVFRSGRKRRAKVGPMVAVGVLVLGGAWVAWRAWSDRGPGEGPLASASAAVGDAGGSEPGGVGESGRAPATPPPVVMIDQGAARVPERAPAQTVERAMEPAPVPVARTPEPAATTDATPAPATPMRDPGALSEAIRQAQTQPTGAPPAAPAPASSFTERRGTEVGSAGAGVSGALAEAEARIARNDPVGARAVLAGALLRVPPAEAGPLRDRLTRLNDDLVFSPTLYEGVPATESYTVQAGDTLSKIAYRRDLAVDWRLIQRVNRISDPSRIRVGQTLKLVRGPFHGVVDKSEFRMDLYQGPPEEPDRWTYIRSFDVGLGEDGGTPTGVFRVRPDSKLINPRWTNPRTGEHFEANDPKNPIGEYWIGLQGLGESAVWEGYGVHGTIDPGSIGQERSMGCVRLGSEDVAFVYELLEEGVSVVVIEP